MPASILKNFSWLTLSSVLTKPLWLGFITLGCMRVLDDEGYGILTAALFLTAITNALTELGLSQYSTREVARRHGYAARFFSNLFPARVVLALLGFCLAVAAGLMLGYTGPKLWALVFAGCYTLALGLTHYCRAYYRAIERMEYEAVSVAGEKILVTAAGLALLLTYRTPQAVLAGMALGMLMTLLLNLRWVTHHVCALAPRLISRRFILRVLPAALPLGLASQFVMIYFRTDAVMIEVMAGAAAAGQYGAAYRLLEACMMITTMVATVTYPRLSNLYHGGDTADFKRIFLYSTLFVLGFGLAVAAGFTLLAHPIMLLLKGDATFFPAASALQLLAWAAPFMCLNSLLSVTLSATDDQRMLATVLGLAALLNVAMNLVLIPHYTIFGACAATIVTEAAITLSLGWRYYRYIYLQRVTAV